jgi:chloride channel protein, CIC family
MNSYAALVERIDKARLAIVDRLVKLDLSQDLLFLFLASLVGISSGYGAVLFHEAIRLVTELLFVHLHSLYAEQGWSMYVVALYPAVGGLAAGIIAQFAPPDAKGHGVPDVIKAVIARGGYMRSSLAVFKTLISAFSIGSGGGAGREGPIVQIGAVLGSAVGRFFRMSSDQLRTLVASGAAGGIAAIFNAPLGGVMFALEIIMGGFSVRTFSPIVVSAVLATAVSRSYLGDHPTFVASNYHLVSNYELFFYLLLGMMSGVVSVWFVKVMFRTEHLCKKLKRFPRVLRPAIGGLVVGIVLIWLPSIAGFSYSVNNQAILGQAELAVLIAVLVLKPIVVGVTLGSGGSGGVFAPALKAGAAFGGLVGILLHFLFPEETAASGAYALVGMGALVAGTMHAPMTAIIMIFEVSDTYQVILPIMFAAVSSTVVARLLMKGSIYTIPLEREGIEIGYGINLSIIHSIDVASIVRRKFVRVRRATPLRELMKLVTQHDQSVYPVVGDDNALLGIVRFQELREVMREPLALDVILVEDIMMRNIPTFQEHESLDKVLKSFELTDIDTIPVVADPQTRILVGIVRHEDVLRRYRKEILLRSSS